MKIIRMTNTEDEHFKIWVGQLLDNNDVITSWGRIGNELQSKTFKDAGEKFLEKKINEKLKKGYEIDSED